jgi:hypothetical protein
MSTSTSTARPNETTEREKDQTIAAVAAALGADWRVRPAADTGIATRTILHAAGYGCTFHWSMYPAGRIEIGGVYPVTADGKHLYPSQVYGTATPGITVSTTRTSKAIAAEITRRFLPAYLPVYDKLAERAAGADAYTVQTAATLAQLQAGVPGSRAGSRDHSATLYLYDNRAYSVTAQGKDVRIEAFSCPADVAIAVLRLLTKPAPAEDRDA